MIVYLSPGSPETTSGGTRKLYDHVAILQQNGFDATVVHDPSQRAIWAVGYDIIVIPEVYGDGLRYLVPDGIRRISFVQNSYLVFNGVTTYGPWTQALPQIESHPFVATPDLVAIFTESQHTEDRLRAMFPALRVPLIRTHSSGNGRNGQPGPFRFGTWPRKKQIAYFEYKHAETNARLFERLRLPEGWRLVCLSGMSDEQIAQTMRESSIFVATNQEEGMCAPTSEAMISGCLIVAWPGGPVGQSEIGGPMEYLRGRARVVNQDDVEMLAIAVERSARTIDENPHWVGAELKESSEWFQTEYSREREIAELCGIFDKLHGR